MAIQIATLQSSRRGPGSPIVGIDLGTTNSLVAMVRSGKPEVLVSRDGRRMIPSVVSIVDSKIVVGDIAKSKKALDASHTVFSVKRLLGRGYKDLEQVAKTLPYQIVEGENPGVIEVQIDQRRFTAVEISAMILKEVKASAEQALGVGVTQAVITVPAYFNDSQRQATRTAGRLAGLEVLRVMNEPTAAALAYGLDKKKNGLIAVYDLGGGTFDISILKLHDGIFEVLSTHGNTVLGGDDLDQAMVSVMEGEIASQYSIQVSDHPVLRATLIEAAEKSKIEFSERPRSSVSIRLPNDQTYERTWSVEEFESLVLPILKQTQVPCLEALKDAGLMPQDLSDVVLVGGPTRLKIVQRVAQEIFGKVPNASVHPDEVVAQGAAIQADILAGNNQDLLLLDVVPLSLGIETYGGVMSPLISRNSRIPTSAREAFTTFVDNQTSVDIHVLQGEREKVEDNRSLARFKLKGIAPMPAGMPRIEVTFLIDADGILQVAAKDLQTRKEQSIEVKPSFGLTDERVEAMLLSSLENVEGDAKYKDLVQARNKAEPVLLSTEKRLPDADRLLSGQEVAKIRTDLLILKEALKGDDIPKIQEAAKKLNDSTTRLAELIVKEAIAKAERTQSG